MLPHGWLFPGQEAVSPLSIRQLNRACHAAAEAAGITKRVSPHTPWKTMLPGNPKNGMGLADLHASQGPVSPLFNGWGKSTSGGEHLNQSVR
jgi:hypothetical protein